MNASLSSIAAGLRPVVHQGLDGVDYFQFRNGQVRRQMGYGHSREERRVRRHARRDRQRRIKQGNRFADPITVDMFKGTAAVLHRLHTVMRRAADRAALSSL